MKQVAHALGMSIVIIVFILVVGPLAVFFGADSRLAVGPSSIDRIRRAPWRCVRSE